MTLIETVKVSFPAAGHSTTLMLDIFLGKGHSRITSGTVVTWLITELAIYSVTSKLQAKGLSQISYI